MTNRDSILTEQTTREFAEAHGFRMLEGDQIATNPSVAFRVETFEPAEGFTPSKPFATRLLWRDGEGNDQSKLLVAAPTVALAVILRGETDAQLGEQSSASTSLEDTIVRRPPRRRTASPSADTRPQQ